ncbi:MAG: TAXI family TRAP transporter solute-binding subunit [Pseudomonadota bacterium]
MKRTLIVAAAALGIVAAGQNTAAAQEDYLLATASTGGTYYPVGVALATLVKVRLQPGEGIGMSAINSAGSGENVALLRDGEVDFAIIQGLFGAYAATGTGPLAEQGVQENVRSISLLWPNVEHFIVKNEYVDTGTISDIEGLKGETVSFGRQNSGTIGSNRTILSNLGHTMDDEFDLAFMGYSPSADALQNGQIEAMSTPAGPPVAAVSAAFANMGDDITLLSFTEEQRVAANGDFDDLWVSYTIPAGLYPGVDEDVQTIAQPNFLAVNASVPEETVYMITKTIYENLPFLQAIHPATNAMSLDVATNGLPVKLHPGALRYYEEMGVDVPDRLK